MAETNTRTDWWVVLTFGDDRQYGGNSGYADEPSEYFVFDSFVANHKQVEVGHRALVCDRKQLIGIGVIDRIEKKDGTKVQLRCPACGTTGIKIRKTRTPQYRCTIGHEFGTPKPSEAPCKLFTAHFGSFYPVKEPLDRKLLRAGCPRYTDQSAIQSFVPQLMFESRVSVSATFDSLLRQLASFYLPADQAEEQGTYRPSDADERLRAMRAIAQRRGQREFRDSLRRRYGERCMVTGCGLLEIIEAAHLNPYRGEADQHAENGLLLRADIHTLFDLDLLGIDPETLRVVLNPTIDVAPYSDLANSTLLCDRNRPSDIALRSRWDSFKRRLPTRR